MKMKEYNKLIRDRIGEVIEKEGRIPVLRTLDNDEYMIELKKKLLEEVDEFLNAPNESVIEEMADIYEVLEHLQESLSIKEEDLLVFKAKKAQIKGKFRKRLFLVGVKEKE
jgi:predicted house-cleaning noncanonical NTP pyrophosphatase (MazG superfamily)